MVVRVQLFGPEAERLGAKFLDVPMGGPATCEAVLGQLQRMHPQLIGRLAVNHAFAPPQQLIHEDDEVALIGLVSGG